MLRQPIIIGYIVSGIVLSPNLLGVLGHHDGFATYSQIGISFLLFMVGLGLNPRNIREVGKPAIVTGLSQVALTTLFALLLGQLFGLTPLYSLYLALGLSFSSTIIIMKLLSDKNALETLYGRISVGFLITQDLVAMLILMFVSASAGGSDLASTLTALLAKSLLLGGFLYLASVKALPWIGNKMARSQEMLLLFSITWCISLAGIFALLGFSLEIGALLAGVTLSVSPYKHEISAKMKPLRDFFIMIFFVLLGSQMILADISRQLGLILFSSALVLIGNPLIVLTVMGRLGYTRKTSFMAGLTVAQISEFSLILATLGIKVGHIPQ
jgi:Kef-type K+ transport system membrane component KefB